MINHPDNGGSLHLLLNATYDNTASHLHVRRRDNPKSHTVFIVWQVRSARFRQLQDSAATGSMDAHRIVKRRQDTVR